MISIIRKISTPIKHNLYAVILDDFYLLRKKFFTIPQK